MSLQLSQQVRSASFSSIPQQVLDNYYFLYKRFSAKKKWRFMNEKKLWMELCLCILSSNIQYELAQSALSHLNKKNLIDPYWIIEKQNSLKIIAFELSKPIYHPAKKDGSLRKYRFPNVRARDLVKSAYFLYSDGRYIKTLLTKSNSIEQIRSFLVENISGLGLKESSHFLRNIGFDSSLAIIDVHIVSFLKDLKIISKNNKPITPKYYFELEKKMQELAEFYGLNLGVLDNAIWYYMKYKASK